MTIDDLERLLNISDAGDARHLAEALIRPFNTLASSQRCQGRLLKHGISYQRGPGNAVFSLYFSKTSSPGSAEVALAEQNIARLYHRSPEAVAQWLTHLTTKIGKPVKSSTSQQYPRVSVDTVESGLLLAQAIDAFLKDKPYQYLTTSDAIQTNEEDRITTDKRIMQAILGRRGQSEFRQRLLQAYNSRCAITGCDVLDTLEAAHITPFAEENNYDISNGLILRSDIHILFDLFLLSIDPATWTVYIAPHLSPFYAALNRTQFSLPTVDSAHPDTSRLLRHYTEWCARCKGVLNYG